MSTMTNETISDYNWRTAGQPYAIAGLVTNLGNIYCADCASHVLHSSMDEEITVIFADADFCGTCNGCDKVMNASCHSCKIAGDI